MKFPVDRPYQGATLTLTSDQKEMLIENLRGEMVHAQLIHELISNSDALEKEVLQSYLLLRESGLTQFSRVTGVELETASQRTERFAMLRDANLRVRALEKMLGETGNVEQTQAQLCGLADKLRSWWRQLGMGHTSEVSFTASGGVIAKFSGMLFGPRKWRCLSTGKVLTGKEAKLAWLAYLRDRGFQLSEGDDSERLLDNDHNRELLQNWFDATFPSSRMLDVQSTYSGNRKAHISEMTLFIERLADVHGLQVDELSD